MLVKDLMTPNPLHIAPHRSVADAEEMMREHGVRHLPVLDDDGQLLGLVTRSSLGRALPGMGTGLTRFEFSYLTSSTSVSEVMVKEPAVISEGEAVEEAARVMNTRRISSLLVVRDEELVGIITDTDLFEALLELLGARRPGVRLTVHFPDRSGELARITKAVAEPGGYISAVGGWYLEEGYGAFFKIENLAPEKVVEVVEELPDITVADVRGELVEREE
jgi:acetoin utilization protein AcuB